MTPEQTAHRAAWTALDQLTLWGYRAGAFLLLHVIDEPAWMALLFC